jgi:HPt (histidine-containing phosphotransfer) domain-containing protein
MNGGKTGVSFPRQLANLDRAVALERVGGDTALLREIVGLFLEEYPRLLAEIRSSLDSGDPVRLERAAHSLKGSVGNFGARAAFDAALRLELLGRAHDLGPGEDAWQSLQREMERLRPALVEMMQE